MKILAAIAGTALSVIASVTISLGPTASVMPPVFGAGAIQQGSPLNNSGTSGGIDYDVDGTSEVSSDGTDVFLDANDDGTADFTFGGGTNGWVWSHISSRSHMANGTHSVTIDTAGNLELQAATGVIMDLTDDGTVDLTLTENGTDGVLIASGTPYVSLTSSSTVLRFDSSTEAIFDGNNMLFQAGGSFDIDAAGDNVTDLLITESGTDGVLLTVAASSSSGTIQIDDAVGVVADWSGGGTLTLDGSKAQLSATSSGDDVALVADDEIQFDAGGGGADATFLATRATWTNLRHHTFAFDDSTCTIADSGDANPGAGTCTPSAFNFLEITCNDTDGCDLTVGETGVNDGMIAHWVNVGTNTVNFADTAGVTELAGAFAAGQYDSITMIYVTTTWVEVDRSDN